MFNKEIFLTSLKALIDFGDNELYYDNMRSYIVQYEETKRYMSNYKGENDILSKYYSELPELEYKEFNNPVLKLLSKWLQAMKDAGAWVSWYGNLMDYFEDPGNDIYPARKRYYNDLVHKVLNINPILIQMAKELSEEGNNP